jgi:hypothetical protein
VKIEYFLLSTFNPIPYNGCREQRADKNYRPLHNNKKLIAFGNSRAAMGLAKALFKRQAEYRVMTWVRGWNCFLRGLKPTSLDHDYC